MKFKLRPEGWVGLIQAEVSKYVFKAMAGGWEETKNTAQGAKGPGWLEQNEKEEAKLGEIKQSNISSSKRNRKLKLNSF